MIRNVNDTDFKQDPYAVEWIHVDAMLPSPDNDEIHGRSSKTRIKADASPRRPVLKHGPMEKLVVLNGGAEKGRSSSWVHLTRISGKGMKAAKVEELETCTPYVERKREGMDVNGSGRMFRRTSENRRGKARRKRCPVRFDGAGGQHRYGSLACGQGAGFGLPELRLT